MKSTMTQNLEWHITNAKDFKDVAEDAIRLSQEIYISREVIWLDR